MTKLDSDYILDQLCRKLKIIVKDTKEEIIVPKGKTLYIIKRNKIKK